MKKIIISLAVILFLGVFFALPIIPDSFVFTTRAQKEQHAEFCNKYSCGLSILITPYQSIVKSISNLSK